jgi:hypothetical protein
VEAVQLPFLQALAEQSLLIQTNSPMSFVLLHCFHPAPFCIFAFQEGQRKNEMPWILKNPSAPKQKVKQSRSWYGSSQDEHFPSASPQPEESQQTDVIQKLCHKILGQEVAISFYGNPRMQQQSTMKQDPSEQTKQ